MLRAQRRGGLWRNVEVEVGRRSTTQSLQTPGRSGRIVALEIQRSTSVDQLPVRCNIQRSMQGQPSAIGTAETASPLRPGSKSCRLPAIHGRVARPCGSQSPAFDDPRPQRHIGRNNPTETAPTAASNIAPERRSCFRCGASTTRRSTTLPQDLLIFSTLLNRGEAW